MYESTRILLQDLALETKNPAMEAIIERAKKDFYNDYFGVPDAPQSRLIFDLRRAKASEEIIENVTNGKYDGTSAEANEWAKSPEGVETFKDLIGKRSLKTLEELIRNYRNDNKL